MKQARELFAKQMTRKEFLEAIGMAVLMVFGVSNFVSFLTKQTKQTGHLSGAQKKEDSGQGFGTRKFGV
jgi:hypothetical protein|tara:strand:- start:575 stop:781 length:207 start_codon:yes stop_codon:yes gene_type:complete